MIHQDEDVEVDDAEPVFGPSSFPPPPEVPYPSSLQVSQPLEFRQNVSISSVSTDNDDDYEDSDDCPTSGLKGNSETEEEEEEVLVGHDLHLPVPDSVLAVEDYTEEIFTHARKREVRFFSSNLTFLIFVKSKNTSFMSHSFALRKHLSKMDNHRQSGSKVTAK